MNISRRSAFMGALAGGLASALLCGTALATPFTATIQITGSDPVDLRSLADTAGYTGGDANITFEVGNGVGIVGSAGSGDPAYADGGAGIDTGTWSSGSAINLSLVVKSGGGVYGGGGGGGHGGATGFNFGQTYGGAGGDAIYARAPISVTVQSGGAIVSGGSGGQGGQGADLYIPSVDDYCWGGGGGGGGFPNGQGGYGGDNPQFPWYWCYTGNSGSDGTWSGGGAGGAELSGVPWGFGSGNGSSGNGAGSGNAIRKNGYSVSLSNSGTVIGAVN